LPAPFVLVTVVEFPMRKDQPRPAATASTMPHSWARRWLRLVSPPARPSRPTARLIKVLRSGVTVSVLLVALLLLWTLPVLAAALAWQLLHTGLPSTPLALGLSVTGLTGLVGLVTAATRAKRRSTNRTRQQ
jgi:hypothetical protein